MFSVALYSKSSFFFKQFFSAGSQQKSFKVVFPIEQVCALNREIVKRYFYSLEAALVEIKTYDPHSLPKPATEWLTVTLLLFEHLMNKCACINA